VFFDVHVCVGGNQVDGLLPVSNTAVRDIRFKLGLRFFVCEDSFMLVEHMFLLSEVRILKTCTGYYIDLGTVPNDYHLVAIITTFRSLSFHGRETR
jgi:hypothetical protein